MAKATSRRDVLEAFGQVVNMTPSALRSWLDTDESRKVGWPSRRGDGESIGHRSGRRILEIMAKQSPELTDDDVAHMRRVVAYVHRHLAQRPRGDVTRMRWRYSLMNWGHDPLTTQSIVRPD